VVRLDAPRYRAPGALRITLADGNLDRRPDVAEFARVTLSSTSSPGGRSVTVRETGSHTGVFEGAAAFSTDGSGGELRVQAGDTLTVRYADADDGTGRPATAVATAVVDGTSPDLALTLTAPRTAPAGAVVDVQLTAIADAGGGATEAPSRLRVRLCDPDGREVALAEREVPPLAPGASDAQAVRLAVPAGSHGAHRIVAELQVGADAEGRAEGDRAEARLEVTGPDLRAAVKVDAPAALAGEAVEITTTVWNDAGGGDAPATALRLDLYDASGKALAHLADLRVPALPAGAARVLPAAVTLPDDVHGAFVIRAVIDLGAKVAEREEGNNVADARIALRRREGPAVAAPTPDARASAADVGGAAGDQPLRVRALLREHHVRRAQLGGLLQGLAPRDRALVLDGGEAPRDRGALHIADLLALAGADGNQLTAGARLRR
jgi:hypothetical protein